MVNERRKTRSLDIRMEEAKEKVDRLELQKRIAELRARVRAGRARRRR